MLGVCGGGRCDPRLEGGGVRVALVRVLRLALIRGWGWAAALVRSEGWPRSGIRRGSWSQFRCGEVGMI